VTALRKDGTTFPAQIQGRMIQFNGRPVRVTALRDITERKKAEARRKYSLEKLRKYKAHLEELVQERTEALRQTKRFLETVFDSIQDGISVLDTKLNILFANKKMEKWYSHMLPLVGKKCYEAYHQRSSPCKDCPTCRALKTGKLEMVEHPLKQEDINVGTVELYAFPILDDTGKPIGVVENIRNITERKRAEAATQEAHQRLIAVLDSMDAAIYVADMETYELLFVNRYTQSLHGNILGKKCWHVFQEGKTGPCEFCTNDRLLDATRHPTGVYQWEFYNTKTGRWYECRDNALRWIDGRMVRLEIALDITDRKHAEEAIRENEQKYRTLFEETLNPILMVDEKKRYIDANKAALEFLECEREDLLHRDVWDFAPSDKLDIMKKDHTPFFSHRTTETDYFVHGAVKTLMLNVVPLKIKSETVLYGIGQDITKRKQFEEEIETSLREKETLLKEVHHRVKNNMQVISSLLNLQIMRSKDEQVKKALMDCQGRIQTMASVHQMLYMSDRLSVIDCHAYISKLSFDILQSYHPNLHRVKLTVDAKGVTLGIQKGLSLGLIINEILSNSLKYGFPKNRLGQITIRVKVRENDIIEFVFSDNGIGIPEDIDWRNTKSLGLNLIVLLTENQLHGTISMDRKEGTTFTIKFRREEIE
jgi:PAS domain S-box-containing protein